MKKLLLITFALILASSSLKAQDYNWSVGVRGGESATGIVGKYFFSPANSVEAIFSFVNGFNVYGMYERNLPVIEDGFNFYYGVGGNVGSWRRHHEDKFTVGVDGVVGLEYTIRNVPLAFSVDYKPCLNFVGHTGFRALDFGLTMKVVF